MVPALLALYRCLFANYLFFTVSFNNKGQYPLSKIDNRRYYYIETTINIHNIMASHLIDNLIGAIRFFVGLILVIIAMRAYLKTRTSDMFYLTGGFALITIGNLFSTIYYVDDIRMDKLLANIFDILGLIALIIAVRKS